MPNLDPDPDKANKRQIEPRKAEMVTPLSLLERARAHDAEAWRQLVKLYQSLVLFWCRKAGLGVEDREDLAQEVFAAAALNLSTFHRDKPGDTFRGWLRVITNNQISLHRRRAANQPQAVGGSDALEHLNQVPDPLAGCEEEEVVEFSRVCRRALEIIKGDFEESTWQAFWLTVIEQREPATLTQELGLSAAAIRKAKSRVLRRLRLELGEVPESDTDPG